MMCSVSVVLPLDSGPKISMHAAARNARAAQGDVERQRCRSGCRRSVARLVAVQLHDGALAELLFDLLNGAR